MAEITLLTGDSGKDASGIYTDPYLLGLYFSVPYAVYPGGIAFVVEAGFRPQGYIVSVPDTIAYRQWLEDEWLPPLRLQFPVPESHTKLTTENDRQIIERIHRKHLPLEEAAESLNREYPAHLHIDLLPSIQRKGYGKKLMNMLFEELAGQGVPGVQLGVAKRNTGAVAFYNNVGFSVLRDNERGYSMGKKF